MWFDKNGGQHKYKNEYLSLSFINFLTNNFILIIWMARWCSKYLVNLFMVKRKKKEGRKEGGQNTFHRVKRQITKSNYKVITERGIIRKKHVCWTTFPTKRIKFCAWSIGRGGIFTRWGPSSKRTIVRMMYAYEGNEFYSLKECSDKAKPIKTGGLLVLFLLPRQRGPSVQTNVDFLRAAD